MSMDNEELVGELMKHRLNEVKVLVGAEAVPIAHISYEPVGDIILIHLKEEEDA